MSNLNSASCRVAVFTRQSKGDPDGIERQLPRARKLAEFRGWTVVHTHADDGPSASKQRGPGTQWARMLADANAGRIDTVIAVDLDHLLRTTLDLNVPMDHNVMAVTVDGEIDLSTSGGEFRATMLASIARFEVRRKGERQSRGQVQRAQQGRPPKGTRPLGYATDGSIIAAEAAAVRELFRFLAIEDGPSIAALAAGLSGKVAPHVPASLSHLPKHTRTLMIERNKRRAAIGEDPAPVPPDGPWHSSTVLGILRNPRHAGYSVYTDRNARAQIKRRTWYAQIARDEHGNPVTGPWTPSVDELTWLAVQERLDDQRRVTNRSGSTARKHLGSRLYLCGLCEKPVKAHSLRYRCPDGHLMRARRHVDDWVLQVIRLRLAQPDLAGVIMKEDSPRLVEIQDAITKHQGKITRAQRDYDAELIEGPDLQCIRDSERELIELLEIERRVLTSSTDLAGVLGARDPVAAFDDSDLAIQRRVVDLLCTVRLLPHPRGKKTFNPETVQITPKRLG